MLRTALKRREDGRNENLSNDQQPIAGQGTKDGLGQFAPADPLFGNEVKLWGLARRP